MSTTAPTAAQLTAVVSAKAARDQAFAKELLANPQAAVEKLLGTALPAHITLQAVAQPVGTYVIPVPTTTVVGAGGELSDSDLEAVAGGSKSGANDFFNGVADVVTTVGSMAINDGVSVAQTTVGNAGAHNAAGVIGQLPQVC